ncbi:hypothetical protein BDQ17DRAFT_1335571 [Cyathus striatus]|nr:hypothetical protein BDQ17DRAFT_1335571 [Cyathus striatus]
MSLRIGFTVDNLGWMAVEHDILCMEHALHLAAKHFVSSLDQGLPDIEEGDDGDDVFMFTPGDALGKVLALVKQIRMSPQARTFFKSTCMQVNINPLELLLWVHTQWGSLHQF